MTREKMWEEFETGIQDVVERWKKRLDHELKTGYWIENAPEYQNIDPPYICSECGNMHLRKTNYCDQCGARMIETQESDDSVDVLDKIKGYVDHIRNTGMGKKKSLEFIEKFIEGLKAESEKE